MYEHSGEGLKFDPHELNEPLQRAGALQYAADIYPQLKVLVRQGFPDVESLLEVCTLVCVCVCVSVCACVCVHVHYMVRQGFPDVETLLEVCRCVSVGVCL